MKHLRLILMAALIGLMLPFGLFAQKGGGNSNRPPKDKPRIVDKENRIHHRLTATGGDPIKLFESFTNATRAPKRGSRRFRSREMKTKNFIIGAFLVVLASVAVANAQPYMRRQSSVNSGLVARAQQVTGDRFTVATTTARGVTVVARVTPRPEVLQGDRLRDSRSCSR